jgi:hypothetical protein
MKTLLFKVLPHVLASVICLVVFTGAPILLYGVLVVVGIFLSGDPGGPLNFIIIPVFSVLLAVVTTFILLLPITATLQWLSRRLKFSRWIPLFGIFPASFLVFITVAFTASKPQNVGGTIIFLLIWCLIGRFVLHYTGYRSILPKLFLIVCRERQVDFP